MKMNNFRGDLSGISAKTATLPATLHQAAAAEILLVRSPH